MAKAKTKSVSKPVGEEFSLAGDFQSIADELGVSLEEVEFTTSDDGETVTLTGVSKKLTAED